MIIGNLNTIGAKRALRINTNFDDSNISRLEPTFPTYAGSTITVGSAGDYTKLNDAVDAANSNDIIEILENLNLDNETAGWMQINVTGKNLLIKGTNDTITLTGTDSTFCAYVVRYGDLTFQDLNIIGTVTVGTSGVYNVTGSAAGGRLFFDNVNITNLGASKAMFIKGNTNQTDTFIKDSTILSIAQVLELVGSTNNNQIFYFSNCTINTTALSDTPTIKQTDLKGSNLYMYGCDSNTASSGNILQLGSDTSEPDNLNVNCDIRDCTFQFNDAIVSVLTGHCILIGRGTDNVKFINNNVTIFSTSSSSAMGLVLKTTPSGDDAIIGGNIVTAHLPLRIKGSRDLDIQQNYFVSNYLDNYGVYISNIELESTDYNCDNITFRKNYLRGGVNAIQIASSTSETAKTTSASWDFDYNVQYASSKYLVDLDNVEQYTFVERSSFWNQDRNSNWRILN